MGGDLGPPEVVAAVKLAFDKIDDLSPVTLVGDQSVLAPLVKEAGLLSNDRFALHHAPQSVTMDDKPANVWKKKKDSSMLQAIDLVKQGQAGAVVSCGNTGALMFAGTLGLRMMAGVERSALAAVIPRENGYFILIDAGANPEATPLHLVHNAILGSHYCRVRLGVKNPRVGLMSNGTEESKGNALTIGANELFRRSGNIVNYVGPIEGFQTFTDTVDVVVCDGFVGNIMLKSWESLAKFFTTTLKTELKSSPIRMAGAMLSKGAFTALKHRVNPERYSGAPLMGLKGNILKAHGSSNRHAIASAIGAANEIIAADMNQLIENDIAQANTAIGGTPA